MNADDGRPTGITHEDEQEWLARYDTPDKLVAAHLNAVGWLGVMRDGRCGKPREQGLRHWQRRIQLLRSKALLMGVHLGE